MLVNVTHLLHLSTNLSIVQRGIVIKILSFLLHFIYMTALITSYFIKEDICTREIQRVYKI